MKAHEHLWYYQGTLEEDGLVMEFYKCMVCRADHVVEFKR